MTSTETLKLNLGSRDRQIPGFKSLDCEAHLGVDFVGDAFDLSRFADGSVSEIMASHILEHAPHTKTASVLIEWHRVLSPGGILYVAVPDFKRAVEIYQKHGIAEWVQNFIMGDQLYPTGTHFSIFDEPRLEALLLAVGFKEASRVVKFPFGVEDCSSMLLNLDGKPVSLNMVAVK